MTDEEKNLLTITAYYVVYSSNTGYPYIDKDGYCCFFETEVEANNYAESVSNQIPDTLKVQDAKQFKTKELCAELYGYGIIGIRVFKRGKESIDVDITEDDAKSGKRGVLYNPAATRLVLRAQEVMQKQYLRALRSQSFYAPVIVDKRQYGQYPHLAYCYATFKTSENYYLLFTTLEEFYKWNMTQENAWSPLECQIAKFDRIRKNNPVLINPISNQLFLDSNTFNIIKSGTKENI